MKNTSSWTASKFLYRDGLLRANPSFVSAGSRLMAERIAAFYGEQLPRHARGRLADLGCGPVPLYAAYRELVDEITCVDWANTAHSDIHLDLVADLTQPALPFPDGAFNTLILSDVLEHVPEPAALWEEMARLLAPDGRLLLNVPFLYWLHEQPHDHHRYSEHALRRYAERAGLAVHVLEPLGGAFDVLADISAKLLARIPRGGRPLAVALQTATRVGLGTSLGGRLTLRTARRFPLAYGMVAGRD
ncbi:MAG: hypothetical protein MAG453_00175 [Calditrichaeota bacterium]|nr:hypothetical protein [Calditrichota bacterium]